MSLADCPLPTDPEALRSLAADLQAELARKEREIAANAAEIYAKTLHIEKLKMQLAALRRARFGRSSEKLDHDIEQLELLIGELEENVAADEARAKTPGPATGNANPVQPRPRRQPVRTPLPPHLPRQTVVHEPACTCPGCGGTTFSRIGDDEREVLEYVPASFKVIKHVRPKLSCRACETVMQAPMPTLPIERGRPGPGLIAHVLVSKFCDHVPLHRQSVIYAREGVELGRTTLADWVGQAEFLLSPLAEAIGCHVRAGSVLHADDTTVPVLAPGRGKTKTGRLWTVVRDERPWGSDMPPAAFYLYSPDRKGIRAEELLGNCSGFLHADGYTGFDRLYRPTTPGGDAPLIEVACWSHARRGFYEVHHATASPIALEALERIAALFAIESAIRGQPPERRVAVRQEHATPLLEQLKVFLETSLRQVSGKSELAKAIRYALSRWKALARYVSNGRLEMSNNAAERAMRSPVLGRRNYLFCGSDAGGRRAACIYTIIETCKLNSIDPQAYLTDILGRIADHPIQRISELLPWHWKK
ncbi:transposase (plasmid) [Rhodovastum atsumiense]|uniref:IS66 family transposase n=1 Tax=Rhodovastum atsumiense TaxID=504468 RepID=A0A5M6II88_9PROT|nr:IS66 family transposase [Rhodovastum atsumiense]KAA5607980.1 IS66 family transposase [Rhodovastum atsumiense]CAH2606032.1 transposase [Rhodovastum atsumiense]